MQQKESKTNMKSIQENAILSEQTRMALHSNVEVINTLANLLNQEYNFYINEQKNRIGLSKDEEQIIKNQLIKYVNNL